MGVCNAAHSGSEVSNRPCGAGQPHGQCVHVRLDDAADVAGEGRPGIVRTGQRRLGDGDEPS
jgi:hypothetical protein